MNGQKPFEGDRFIPLEIIKLRNKFKLVSCIETGTQYGNTTKEFCKIFSKVLTIEADLNYFDYAKENLKDFYVEMVLGKSEVEFKKINIPDNTFIYLDAHGCEIGGCPLKKELEIITEKKADNIVIAIHDFKVPNHPEFGFDAYDFELKFEEIEVYLQKIYPKGFDYHYNSEADGANRGIIYIYPKI